MTDKNKTATTGNSDGKKLTQCGKCHCAFIPDGDLCPWCGEKIMIIKCKSCGKHPDEIEEYVDCAREEKMTPDELAQTDGTFNQATGEFYCTDCYISNGMPLGTA